MIFKRDTNQEVRRISLYSGVAKYPIFLRKTIKQIFQGKYRQDFVLTFATQIVVLIFGLLTLKAAAYFLGTVGFGEYYVARRAYSILNFSLLLGLGISLPRYIALAGPPGEENPQQYTVFLSGLLLGVVVLSLFSIFALMFRVNFARLFYGDIDNDHIAISIILATVGIYLYSLLYAYFRAHLKMWRANSLQIFFIALIPLLAIIVSDGNPAQAIALAGISWLLVSLVVMFFLLRNVNLRQIHFLEIKNYVQELFSYGIGRVPGEFAYFGFFAVPTFMVSAKWGVEDAGFFSFGISLLQMTTIGFASVGVLLLPYVSRLAAQKQWTQVKRVTHRVLGASFLITIILVIIAYFALDLIPTVMGSSFSVAVPQSRILVAASIPFVVYVILRSPIDALMKWPHNSINLTITFLLAIGLIWFEFTSPAMALLYSISVLAVLSVGSWLFCLRHVRAKI